MPHHSFSNSIIMKFIIIANLAALTLAYPHLGSVPAAPSITYSLPSQASGVGAPAVPGAPVAPAAPAVPVAPVQGASAQPAATPVAIIKDERTNDGSGTYSFNFESADGIIISGSGSPSAAGGAVAATGQFKYTAPDGTPVELKFVADENGFQPQSNLLPVAPEFPHPIPQYVLDQIAFAAAEDAAAAKEAGSNPPAPSAVPAVPVSPVVPAIPAAPAAPVVPAAPAAPAVPGAVPAPSPPSGTYFSPTP